MFSAKPRSLSLTGLSTNAGVLAGYSARMSEPAAIDALNDALLLSKNLTHQIKDALAAAKTSAVDLNSPVVLVTRELCRVRATREFI